MTADDFRFTPVVILGAGRSGTNMLRDALTKLEQFETWPCDEINPIWRHRNIGLPNDEIPAERAARSKAFIRKAFNRIWRETGQPDFVVEKTCANTLRVPFVDEVLPEAKYIHIIRDGVDVVASAQKRWKGELELPSLPYYWAKIKYTSITDLPAYGYSFAKNRLAMMRSADNRMEIWGPRFTGMDAMQDQSLDTVCAHQWVECVTQASTALANFSAERHITIKYEAMTQNPAETLRTIVKFLDHPVSDGAIEKAVESVSQRSVGKGRKALTGDTEGLIDIMRPTLQHHGYEG